jgi:uncharacterized membrane protein
MGFFNRFFKKQFFNQDEEKLIMKAIRKAEIESSGEVRLYVESFCKKPTHERALEVFKKLKMHKTKERNAVLIYIAMEDRHFAIFGDEGIHQKMGYSFWNKEAESLKTYLKNGETVEGICQTVHDIGQVLKDFFPPNDDNGNELSDKPVYGR